MRSTIANLSILALLFGTVPAFATTFTDDFSRPNGPVGNGWSDAADNNGGTLALNHHALTTSNPNCRAGIFRPLDYSGKVTIAAPITQMNGFEGLLNRYETQFIFRSDGTISRKIARILAPTRLRTRQSIE